jgi:hypothetical protein
MTNYTVPEALAHIEAAKLERMLETAPTHPACRRARDYAGPGADPAFVVWLRLVERRVLSGFGVSCFDLADYCYRDAFEAGMAPREAALEALEGDDLYGPFVASMGGGL